tara:strand:+ start:1158 stop:1409 length:252 start_codon:yes stop_codon:yes gene_type:complete
MTEGWEGLAPAEPEELKVDDLDLLYAKVFKSPEGQKVLSHMREITIEQPTWVPGEDPSYGYTREGMAQLVRIIEKRLRRTEHG